MDVRARRLALIVLVVALVTNFGYLALQRNDLTSDDSPTYIGPAQQLAAGRGFLNGYGIPETRRTPAYPLFLAPFVTLPHGLLLCAAVQHLLNAALAVAVFVFALQAFGSRTAAACAGLFFAVDLASVHYANQILTETLFTAASFVAAVLLWRRRYVWAALVAGAAVLVRPIGVFLFVPMALFAAFDAPRHRARTAVAVVLCFLIAPVSWALRNRAVAGETTISTITSWSILFDRAAATLAAANPATGGDDVGRWRNELAREAGDPWQATYSNHIQRPEDHFHTERWLALARRVLLAHPLVYAKLHLLAIARLMLGGGAQTIHERLHAPLAAARVAVVAYNGIAALVMIVGIAAAWQGNRRVTLLLLLFIAYALATTSVAESTARFRVPVMPPLAVFFGLGAQAVWERKLRAGTGS